MDEGHAGSTHLEPYTTKVMTHYVNGSSTLKLHFLDVGHPEYKSLADQFTSKWLHKNPVGGVRVMDVIKIEVCMCGVGLILWDTYIEFLG